MSWNMSFEDFDLYYGGLDDDCLLRGVNRKAPKDCDRWILGINVGRIIDSCCTLNEALRRLKERAAYHRLSLKDQFVVEQEIREAFEE